MVICFISSAIITETVLFPILGLNMSVVDALAPLITTPGIRELVFVTIGIIVVGVVLDQVSEDSKLF